MKGGRILTELEKTIERLKKIEIPEPPPRTYECPECQDSGIIVYVGEDGVEYGRTCKCMELKRAKQILKSSGISSEFQKINFEQFNTFDNKELSNAKSTAISYYKAFLKTENERHNSILFSGQVGAGKTHLGMAIANNLMEQKIPVVFMPYRNVVTQLKQNITDEEAYLREMSKYLNARVLFIDDLLKGKITESDVNIMFELINYRYLNHMPMIVTTEKTIEELLKFDEAVGSRIIEMSRGNIVTLQSKSLNYRLRN